MLGPAGLGGQAAELLETDAAQLGRGDLEGAARHRIAQLGGTMTGERELAAGGLLAIPGGVDAHTHLLNQGLGDRFGWFPIWVDDFWSGSRAAIADGITTIGNMTFPVPDDTGAEETPGAAITREMADAATGSAVDWFLHLVLLHPAALPAGEIAGLAGHGHASIKIFLSDPDVAADEPALLAAASAAQTAGSVTLLHLPGWLSSRSRSVTSGYFVMS